MYSKSWHLEQVIIHTSQHLASMNLNPTFPLPTPKGSCPTCSSGISATPAAAAPAMKPTME
jgi:hypothetical protein